MYKTHNHTQGGHSPTYGSWRSMRYRCTKDEKYIARGITVCQEWAESFEAFLRDMGVRPEGMTLDRVDNDKGYYKENCRWATPKQQAYNRSTNVLIEYNGVKQGIRQWADKLGVSYLMLDWRLKNGWTIEEAFTTPSGQGRR